MMTEYPKALGLAIRQIRRERRLTITDLQYETRIAHQAIRKIEQGVVYAKLDTLLKICRALEVQPSTLFTMAERP